MLRTYKLKFYLNASHFIVTSNTKGETHSHCFELILNVIPMRSDEIRFYLLEKYVDDILKPYQNKVINEVPPFNRINPTVENLCRAFSDMIKAKIAEHNALVVSVQLSETPTRSFIINTIETDLDKMQQSDNITAGFEGLATASREYDDSITVIDNYHWEVEVADDADYDIPVDYGDDISKWDYGLRDTDLLIS